MRKSYFYYAYHTLIDDNTSSHSPGVFFINGARRYGVNDILVILSRTINNYGENLQHKSSDNAKSSIDGENPLFMNVIFVSGIDSHALNSSDTSKMASAARRMSLHGVNLTLPSGDALHVTSLNGSYMNESVIRLIAADANGQISIHDYDTVSKVTKLVSEGIDYNIPQNETSVDEPWKFNKISGIVMDDHDTFFLRKQAWNM